jgi:hypothetical protein
MFCTISKVSTIRQKAQTVLLYAKFESNIRVKHEFRLEYGMRPPDDKSIRRGYEQFRGTGRVEKIHYTGQPRICDEDVDHVRQAFVWSPKKSISQAISELQKLQTSVHRIIQKSLHLKPYKLQVIQKLTACDK